MREGEREGGREKRKRGELFSAVYLNSSVPRRRFLSRCNPPAIMRTMQVREQLSF